MVGAVRTSRADSNVVVSHFLPFLIVSELLSLIFLTNYETLAALARYVCRAS
jgi:hypothetical protein